jgi:glucose-1-phosphate cytidylyltransferase
MIACILAGGKGLRMDDNRPKPLVDIAGKPMIEHIMDIYGDYRITDFVVLMGWNSIFFRDWFSAHRDRYKGKEIYLLDTGENSTTGSRVLQALQFLNQEHNICLTYGDGLANVNIEDLIEGHVRNKKTATMTVVHPQDNFGVVTVGNWGRVEEMHEKPIDTRWINGGFFVLNQDVYKYIDADLPFEKQTLPDLAKIHMLWAYAHWRFWKCVDTQKDLEEIRKLAEADHLPWRR